MTNIEMIFSDRAYQDRIWVVLFFLFVKFLEGVKDKFWILISLLADSEY